MPTRLRSNSALSTSIINIRASCTRWACFSSSSTTRRSSSADTITSWIVFRAYARRVPWRVVSLAAINCAVDYLLRCRRVELDPRADFGMSRQLDLRGGRGLARWMFRRVCAISAYVAKTGQFWSAVTALACYDRALAVEPQGAKAWCNKGVGLTNLMRFEDALTHYDRAHTINPGTRAWLFKGQILATHLPKVREAIDRLF